MVGLTVVKRAKPIWINRLDDQPNLLVRFRWRLPAGDDRVLRITAHTRYRLFLKGVGFTGPAPSAKGTARIDEIPVLPDISEVEILVWAAQANSFAFVRQHPFLCGELMDGAGEVLSWTGDGTQSAELVTSFIRETARMSYMQPCTEAYQFPSTSLPLGLIPVELGEDFQWLRRHSPIVPAGEELYPTTLAAAPFHRYPDTQVRRGRSLDHLQRDLVGYSEDSLKWNPLIELGQIEFQRQGPYAAGSRIATIAGWNQLNTGWIRVRLSCKQPGRLAIDLKEWSNFGGDGTFGSGSEEEPWQDCQQSLLVEAEVAREIELISLHAYTFQEARFLPLTGDFEVLSVSTVPLERPIADDARATTETWGEADALVYRAAIRTLEQNAFDLFTDCPTREHAGYLCDSFFTARAAHRFYGDASLEAEFIENFARFELADDHGKDWPTWMLPMCYPSDPLGQTFIPQWPMWLGLQLVEAQQRGVPVAVLSLAAQKLATFSRGILGFKNEFGLLEDLPGWNFIEWSKANDRVGGVHFPTQLLFAAQLDAIAQLLGEPHWSVEANQIRASVAQFLGERTFLPDHAIREEGSLRVQHGASTVGQLFGLTFGYLSMDDPLWIDFLLGKLETECSPVNAFIGGVLHLDLLIQVATPASLVHAQQLIANTYLPMAQKTKTLWENFRPEASLCHGFASVIGLYLERIHELLGV